MLISRPPGYLTEGVLNGPFGPNIPPGPYSNSLLSRADMLRSSLLFLFSHPSIQLIVDSSGIGSNTDVPLAWDITLDVIEFLLLHLLLLFCVGGGVKLMLLLSVALEEFFSLIGPSLVSYSDNEESSYIELS